MKTKVEKQWNEEKERRKACNLDGDRDRWSNADALCYVLTKKSPVVKGKYAVKFNAAVQMFKNAYGKPYSIDIGTLKQAIPSISTHMEFNDITHTVLDLGRHEIMVTPMTFAPFGTSVGMESYPKPVTIDLGGKTIRNITIEIDLPDRFEIMIDDKMGYLHITCHDKIVKVKITSEEYKHLTIRGSADELVIGMRGDILEVIDLVGFRMIAEWKTDSIDLPIPRIDDIVGPFGLGSRETVPFRIINSRTITVPVGDGGRIENRVINFLNNHLLPKYLP